MRDPYSVLGVGRTASADDLKKAYRKLAKQYHPDMHPGNSTMETKFKEVSTAYDFLSDPDRRARYDRGEIDATGQEKGFNFKNARSGGGFGGFNSRAGTGRQKAGGGFSGFSAEDIFSDLFGQGDVRGGSAKMKGEDYHVTVTVDFLDALKGTQREITLPDGRKLKITIPKGTEDGKTLRLKGQGQAGLGGAQAGDAQCKIKIRPHAHFTRKGRDVHLDLPVTLGEAINGAKINVPTMDGVVALKIPEGSNTGTSLRLKGKGVPGGGDFRGDQYVTLKVVLPDAPDHDLRKALEKWEKRNRYDPRAKMGL